ncbi:hypothetical protein PIB30_054275 [Stylosanthes scabra]|uniref:Caspase family p10 domain-containing protein n=1 Tax=Stylosanthes scabra TaxID=79078 RepID=A0ABU6UI70_9FABA|nr:hypothetical protein [Stylosanthes scabra]
MRKIRIQKFQAQIQQDSDSEIHVQIQPDQESKNKKSEYDEIHEEATIQNAIEITDPSTIQHKNPEFTKSIKPQLNSEKQNGSQFQSQEDEDEFDERSIYSQYDDVSVTVVIQQPPPKAPDRFELARGRKKEPASSEEMSCRPANVIDMVTEIPRRRHEGESGACGSCLDHDGDEGLGGANHDAYLTNGDGTDDFTAAREEQTFAKAWVAGVATEENNQDLWRVRDANDAGRSAEVGASAGGMWTTAMLENRARHIASMEETRRTMSFLVNGTPTVTRGVFQAQRQRRLISPIVAKSPPLLAAIFLWDNVEMVRRKGGLLSTVAGEASPRPHANDDQCSPVPAVVESAAAHGWWKHEVDGNWFLSSLRELF